jgi:uncharacterized protein (DUF58 family)
MLYQPLQYLLGYKLTPTGRALVTVMLLSAIGCVTAELPIFNVFCLLASLLFCVEATGILLQPKLQGRAWFPPGVTAGQPLVGQIELRNLGRWPAYDVMVVTFGLPAGMRQLEGEVMLPEIPAQKSATLPVVVQTQQRGRFTLPVLRPHSTFPFNVLRYGTATCPGPVVTVFPAFHPLEKFTLPRTPRYQPGGLLVQGQIGSSPEYVGNREYTYGEPARRLDFRAWARLGKPVVREYQEEFCIRVAIVLDTLVQPRWFGNKADRSGLEAAISLTAAIADALQNAEAIVDFLIAGPTLHVFQVQTQSSHFDQVLEVLSGIEPSTRDPFEEVSPVLGEELDSISTVLCIFTNWDEVRSKFVQQVIDAGCEPRVFLVRDQRETTLLFPEDGEQFQRFSPQAVVTGEVREL